MIYGFLVEENDGRLAEESENVYCAVQPPRTDEWPQGAAIDWPSRRRAFVHRQYKPKQGSFTTRQGFLSPLSHVCRQLRSEFLLLDIEYRWLNVHWIDVNDFADTFCHTFIVNRVKRVQCPQALSIWLSGHDFIQYPKLSRGSIDLSPLINVRSLRPDFICTFRLFPLTTSISHSRRIYSGFALGEIVRCETPLFLEQLRKRNVVSVLANHSKLRGGMTVLLKFREHPDPGDAELCAPGIQGKIMLERLGLSGRMRRSITLKTEIEREQRGPNASH